ncbi:kinase-like protein [Clavulina sp. PMI_390]|nr:kinase-like protein [Clavulina sp. PMI_390]
MCYLVSVCPPGAEPVLRLPTRIYIGGRWRVDAKIASGSFGNVFSGLDTHTWRPVAIKIGTGGATTSSIAREGGFLHKLRQCIGVPHLHCLGIQDEHPLLIMDLLGPSLERLFAACGRRFTLKTVLMIADQVITRIELVHSHSFLHRDIKPANFVIGLGASAGQIYIIDFGLANRFRYRQDGTHIAYKLRGIFTGNARFASVQAHCGYEQSRRDDLESIGYMLIYFLRGSLPWQGDGRDFNSEVKTTMTSRELCEGLPVEFQMYTAYSRRLGFDEQPDYLYLRQIFHDLFIREGYQNDGVFDWSARCIDQKYVTS